MYILVLLSMQEPKDRLTKTRRPAGPSSHPPTEGDTEVRLNLALRLNCDTADSPRTFQRHRDHVDLVSLTGAAELCDLPRCHYSHQHYQHSCSLCLDFNRNLFSRNYKTKPCPPPHKSKAIPFNFADFGLYSHLVWSSVRKHQHSLFTNRKISTQFHSYLSLT